MQITSPSVNTQKDGEPVPKLDSYSRGMGRFVGNHYIKVIWWGAAAARVVWTSVATTSAVLVPLSHQI